MQLATTLSRSVPSSIRQRGEDYYFSGAVRIDYVDATGAGATVRGSENYTVDLNLEGNTVFACCTCPYADNGYGLVCKHIWATVLAAQDRGFAAKVPGGKLKLELEGDGGRGDYDDDDESEDDWDGYRPPSVYTPRKKPAAKKPPKPPKEKWKDQLAALTRELQTRPASPSYSTKRTDVERELMYVVDASGSETEKKLVLEVYARERKKNNEWGKPKPFDPLREYSVETLPDLHDRRLLSLLKGAGEENGQGYYSSYYGGYGYGSGSSRRFRLSGPLVESVLPALAATGRVCLRLNTTVPPPFEDVVPDLESPWRLAIGIMRNPKHWALSGRLVRGQEAMALSQPKLIIPGVVFWDGRFARLDDAGAFAWVPALRRAGKITVPLSRADELLRQLLAMPQLPLLELPDELRFTEEAVTPRPRLTVKSPKYESCIPMVDVSLGFDYAGQKVTADDPGRGIYLGEERRFVVRDREAERKAAQTLTRLGVKPEHSYGSEPALKLKAAQLPKVVRELVPAGWQVEAEGKLYRQAGEFRLEVKTGQDWFDLNARVDFEGTSVALPRLLAAVHRGESSVVLDDGSLGMVPEDWLQKYGLIARMGKVDGDQVRFSKAQVGVLDALLASRPNVTIDEAFAKARDRLKEFEGVAPVDPSAGFQGQLRGYQREGLGWLHFLRAFGFGGCLADDMGLGKTVQVLSLLAANRGGQSLVVVPRSLIFNWKQEAAKFVPDLKVLDHTGQFRDRTGASFKDYDLVLTTYGTLRNDAPAFTQYKFDTCVLDESQAAKNAETETAKAVRLIDANHRLALSGTPVENHLGELWTLFDFLNPGMLGRGMFVGSVGNFRNPDSATREILAKALRPFILRRTKDQVAKDLPAKSEQTVYCDLEAEQRALYDELRDHYRLALLAKVDTLGIKKSKFQILEALLRLRQAACHPGLIDKKRMKQGSAKLDLLLPQLTEIIESGHKVLVFSQFTSLLAIVKARLDADKVPYEYLDGKTRDRAARVERFQTDPECRLFLVSLKAGGVGLNLTAAEYVYLLDPWWNPAVEAQAIDRSHRIGQTKPVFAYRLIARNTVEEKVLALQQQKRELADAILGGDGRLITDLKREDLELLLS